MSLLETGIADLAVVRTEVRRDERGWFAEVPWPGGPAALRANLSMSLRAGTVRGLHWQDPPHGQTKLVRCVRGSVHDVAVDLRPGSPTLRRHFGVVLTAENGLVLHVPEGFAHGWQALDDGTTILYLLGGAPWTPRAERGLRFDDPALRIAWPLPAVAVSERDMAWPLLGPAAKEGA